MAKSLARPTNKLSSERLLSNLQEISQSFRKTIPHALDAIEILLKETDWSDQTPGRLDEAITVAHQIRGSSGTLGLFEISGSFAVLEDQLKMIRKLKCLNESSVQTALASAIALCRVVTGAATPVLPSKMADQEEKITAPLVSADAREEDVEKIADESGHLILLVEDDPCFISIVQAILGKEENFNNGILSARSLAEASKLLAECEPDIILLDLALPDSEGIQTFHAIQKLAPDVPILILTAIDDTPLADESVACGAQDYLVKGRISPDALNRCIRYSITRFRAEKSMLRLQAIEDFHASLAHDLRVPVQGADRILEHILAGQVGEMAPELRHTLTVLNNSNKALLGRLNKLLNLYRVEFGSVELNWQQTAIMPAVLTAISARQADLEAKGLTVKIDEASDRLNAFTDPHLLLEVFDELLNNAIKFTTNGDTITIRVERTSTRVAIRVSNKGHCIRKEDKRDLFRRFWRGTPGKSYVATSGLGLYYCQQIMNLLDGSISCRSNPGLTTFTVRVPASQADIRIEDEYISSDDNQTISSESQLS